MLALADLTGCAARDPFVGGASHKLQRRADRLIGHDVQIGRLLELYGERLLQRAIENWIPRGVDEIRQQDGILLCKLLSGARPPVESAGNNRRHKKRS